MNADFDDFPYPYPYPVELPQPALLTALAEEASLHSGFTLLKRATAVDLLRDNAGDIAGVRVAGPEGQIDVRAALTVAADGRFSKVREMSGLQYTKIPLDRDVVWLKLPFPAEWDDVTYRVRINGGNHGLFIPTTPMTSGSDSTSPRAVSRLCDPRVSARYTGGSTTSHGAFRGRARGDPQLVGHLDAGHLHHCGPTLVDAGVAADRRRGAHPIPHPRPRRQPRDHRRGDAGPDGRAGARLSEGSTRTSWPRYCNAFSSSASPRSRARAGCNCARSGCSRCRSRSRSPGAAACTGWWTAPPRSSSGCWPERISSFRSEAPSASRRPPPWPRRRKWAHRGTRGTCRTTWTTQGVRPPVHAKGQGMKGAAA